MHWLLIALLVVGVLFGPQLWVQRVMQRHSTPRADIPGTGAELARHLLNQFSLQQVAVEQTDKGDHYDPTSRVVRLSDSHYQGHSLTAIVIAAHEVGHALQDASDYPPLRWRHRLVRFANVAQQLGNGLILATPIITAITRIPSTGLLMLIGGFASLGTAVIVQIITLPVEWDASFKRALPLLQGGSYIPAQDLPAAHSILRAAAFTYVAGTLASLLNLWRWARLVRR